MNFSSVLLWFLLVFSSSFVAVVCIVLLRQAYWDIMGVQVEASYKTGVQRALFAQLYGLIALALVCLIYIVYSRPATNLYKSGYN